MSARFMLLLRGLWLAGAIAWPLLSGAQTATPPARVMLLGLFHFDNPGLDAVKYPALDVMQPAPQAELAALVERLARFAPTRVLLEYPAAREEAMNQRYAEHLTGRLVLPKNEIYQLGFRVAQRAGLRRVHGFDTAAPAKEPTLWAHLDQVPEAKARLMALIAAESQRLQALHATASLRDILVLSNTAAEERRNKGFYMLLNDVGAPERSFHGADASAHWWHRNLRMYALIQHHAAAGERVLVIAGSGHTAILRDLLRADSERVEEDVLAHL